MSTSFEVGIHQWRNVGQALAFMDNRLNLQQDMLGFFKAPVITVIGCHHVDGQVILVGEAGVILAQARFYLVFALVELRVRQAVVHVR